MATVRVSILLGGERFYGRLNRSSVLSDVPAKATRVNRAVPGYKVIRLRRLSHWPSVCRPQIEALQSSYPRPKSRDFLKHVVAVVPIEACERSLIASPPFLPVLSVSPLSFLHLRPGARQGGRGSVDQPQGAGKRDFPRKGSSLIENSANQVGFLSKGLTPSVEGRPRASRR